MSSQVIEAFLPGPAAPRTVEPAPRTGDERSGFRPALDQALHADGRAAAVPADAESAGDGLPPRDADAAGDSGEVAIIASDEAPQEESAVEADKLLDDDAEAEADTANQPLATAVAIPIVAPSVEAPAPALSGDLADASSPAPTPPPAPTPAPASGESPDAEAPASADADPLGAAPLEAGAAFRDEPAPEHNATPDRRAEVDDQTPALESNLDHDRADDGEAAAQASTGDAAAERDPETSVISPAEARPAASSVASVDDEVSASDDSVRSPAVALNGDAVMTPVAAGATSPDVVAAAGESPPAEPAADAPAPAASIPQPAAAGGAAALSRMTPGRTLQPAAPRGEPESADPIDRGRFLGRVEGAIRTAQQRDGRVQVRLSPPELGSLHIELTIEQGVLSARLEAETPAARKLLLDNLPALRERLAQQDVRVDRFDVDVRREGGGSSGGPQDRPGGDPTPRHGEERRERATARPSATIRPAPPPTPRPTPTTGLDIRV